MPKSYHNDDDGMSEYNDVPFYDGYYAVGVHNPTTGEMIPAGGVEADSAEEALDKMSDSLVVQTFHHDGTELVATKLYDYTK